jgi:ribonucleoside-diphosphate reductase alpha chain
MTGQAYLTSAEMAQNLGPFDGYPANRDPILKVVRMHEVAVLDACDANDRIPEARDLDDLWGKATAIWKDVVDFGTIHGFRNAQVTLTAPCGTIAFMMDSGHSTGLEPSIALVQYKTLAGGGMLKIVNPDVERALRTLGYDEEKVAEILAHIEQFDTIEDFQPSIDDDTFRSGLDSIHLPVFDCAFPPANGSRSIAWQGHIKILAAIQPFLSGSSSKTVNMPRDATIDDIRGAYVMAWKMGVKDVAIFRDGSKESQPVSTSKMEARGDQKGSPSQDELFFEANRTLGYIASSVGFDKDDILDPAFLDRLIGRVGEVMCHSADVPAGPHRERLPDTRKSITHKLCVRGNNGDVEAYMTVGEYPDGRPGELFVEIAKEGSTLGGLMDVWATGISLMLQYGVPLDVIVAKFSSGRFEPAGMTRNREIPFASSLVDYIVRWMAMQYLPGYREQHSPQYEPEFAVATSDEVTATNTAQEKILVVGPGGAIATGTYRVKADWFPKVDAVSTPGRSRGQLCPNCGSILQPTGSCWWCNQCMESIGGCG